MALPITSTPMDIELRTKMEKEFKEKEKENEASGKDGASKGNTGKQQAATRTRQLTDRQHKCRIVLQQNPKGRLAPAEVVARRNQYAKLLKEEGRTHVKSATLQTKPSESTAQVKTSAINKSEVPSKATGAVKKRIISQTSHASTTASKNQKLRTTAGSKKTVARRGFLNLDPNEVPAAHLLLYNYPYLEDNIIYLLSREVKLQSIYKFSLKKMGKVSLQNRAIIINWLLIIESYWESDNGTFLQAVRLFDILLQNSYPVNKVQLAGLVSMWVAHKNNTVDKYIISVSDLFNLCKSSYTEKQIQDVEKEILIASRFEINLPEPLTFVAYYILKLKIGSATTVQLYANYLLDVIALDAEFCVHFSSKLAAAAVKHALFLLNTKYNWELLRELPGYYAPEVLVPICRKMSKTLKLVQDIDFSCSFVYKKYNSSKYNFVSHKIKLLMTY